MSTIKAVIIHILELAQIASFAILIIFPFLDESSSNTMKTATQISAIICVTWFWNSRPRKKNNNFCINPFQNWD